MNIIYSWVSQSTLPYNFYYDSAVTYNNEMAFKLRNMINMAQMEQECDTIVRVMDEMGM